MAQNPYTQDYYRQRYPAPASQSDPWRDPEAPAPDPSPAAPAPGPGPSPQGPQTMTREQWRDNWLRQGRMTSQQMDEWMAANGATKLAENGTFRTPYGEVLDLGIGYKTGSVTPGWTGQGGGGAGGAGGAGGPGGAGGGLSGGVSGFTSQIRNLIMQRIGQLNQPFDAANDPTINASMSGARLEADRQTESANRALAERLFAQGQGRVDSNQVAQGAQQSAERAAVGLGTLRGNLIQREYARRAEELQNYYQQALASGDAETARAIQLYMANLDATLRREGMGINLAMFGQGQNTGTVNAGMGG